MTRILLVLILFLVGSMAQAHSFRLGAGTEFPLGGAVSAQFSLPGAPVFVRASVGGFYSPYVDSVNSISESAGFYDSDISVVVSESLDGAFYWEAAFGFEQNPLQGWYVDIGYNFIQGQGELTGAQIINAISGTSLAGGSNLYDLKAEIHSVSLRGGYRFQLKDNLVLALSIGLIKPVDALTTIDRDVSGAVAQAIIEAASDSLDEYMLEVYKENVYVPVLSGLLFYHF